MDLDVLSNMPYLRKFKVVTADNDSWNVERLRLAFVTDAFAYCPPLLQLDTVEQDLDNRVRAWFRGEPTPRLKSPHIDQEWLTYPL